MRATNANAKSLIGKYVYFIDCDGEELAIRKGIAVEIVSCERESGMKYFHVYASHREGTYEVSSVFEDELDCKLFLKEKADNAPTFFKLK